MLDPQVLVRSLHFAAAAVLCGLVCFVVFIAEPTFAAAPQRSEALIHNLRRRFVAIGWSALVLGVASGGAWLLAFATRLANGSLTEAISEGTAVTLLRQTQFGLVWQIRLAMAALMALLLWRYRRQSGWRYRLEGAVAALLAMALMGSLAWAGHGAGGDSLQLASDAIHLLAAGAWVGGLLPFTLLMSHARQVPGFDATAFAAAATMRFSRLGLLSVAALLGTGIANTWYLVGDIAGLLGTTYGRLLLLKIALFLAMLGLAAVNRLRLTPRLAGCGATDRDALRQLQRNAGLELGSAGALLLIVGALGTMPPAAHTQPLWPIPFRLRLGALADPANRGLYLDLAAAALGALLLMGAVFFRRWRWPLASSGGVVMLAFLPRLSPLVVEAFPTSYFVSPTNFSAQSIVAGEQLFMTQCASCHGADGRGNGPRAGELQQPPADLTGHLDAHSDGDLYWWISNGIAQAMPGFAAALDENARWNLVDFLRANAAASHFGKLERAARAPNFVVNCPDAADVPILALAPDILHLVARGEPNFLELTAPLAGPSAEKVRTIVIEVGAAPEAPPFCFASDPDVAKALALYRHLPAQELAGTEFLIDGHGLLRAVWYPGLMPDWHDPAALAAAIKAVARPPASGAAAFVASPAHHH